MIFNRLKRGRWGRWGAFRRPHRFWGMKPLIGRHYLLPLIFLAILGLFVLYPIGNVLWESFKGDGEFGLHNYSAMFDHPHLSRTVWNSIGVACGAAVLSTALGLILALLAFKTTVPFRRLFAGAAVLPMIIPGYVTVLAYIFLFGRNGLITYQWLGITWDVYSWKSVLILQSIELTTTAFLLIAAVIVTIDSRVEDSARNLGASEWNVLTTVTLPLLKPGLIAALLLTFMRSMADFSTPLLVGGKFDTLASASYTQLIGRYDMGMAATLNVVLLALTLIVFALYYRGQAAILRVRAQSGGFPHQPLDLKRPLKTMLLIIGAAFVILLLAMLISVFLAAFTRHIGGNYAFTTEHFGIIPQRGWSSTRNTLFFATVTAAVMSLGGLVLAYIVTRIEIKGRALLDWLATLPFAIPGTFMGVGYAIAFNRPPLLLAGTWMIIIACTVIRELPVGIRAGAGVLSQQDRSIEDASAGLGASPFGTFFRIIIPLARPALLVSALFAFISTIQTLGAIIFLITPGTKLLSVDIFEATYRGDVGDAAALSMIMLGLAAFGAIAIYFIGTKGSAETWFRRILPRPIRI